MKTNNWIMIILNYDQMKYKQLHQHDKLDDFWNRFSRRRNLTLPEDVTASVTPAFLTGNLWTKRRNHSICILRRVHGELWCRVSAPLKRSPGSTASHEPKVLRRGWDLATLKSKEKPSDASRPQQKLDLSTSIYLAASLTAVCISQLCYPTARSSWFCNCSSRRFMTEEQFQWPHCPAYRHSTTTIPADVVQGESHCSIVTHCVSAGTGGQLGQILFTLWLPGCSVFYHPNCLSWTHSVRGWLTQVCFQLRQHIMKC